MAVGWTAFLGSWLMNILFYKVHPSSVDFSEKGMREKLFIHVQGEKHYLWGYRNRDSEGEKYNFVRCLIIFFQTKHTENAESVSEEKSFFDKLKSCLCCCKGTDNTGWILFIFIRSLFAKLSLYT